MSIAWLAALVIPADIAPHPNFKKETTSPIEAIAAVFSAWPYWPEDDAAELRTQTTYGAVQAVLDVVRGEQNWEETLDSFVADRKRPLDMRVALGLVRAVYQSFDDRRLSAINGLQTLLAELDVSEPSADSRLLRA